jgi:hypothetical protein
VWLVKGCCLFLVDQRESGQGVISQMHESGGRLHVSNYLPDIIKTQLSRQEATSSRLKIQLGSRRSTYSPMPIWKSHPAQRSPRPAPAAGAASDGRAGSSSGPDARSTIPRRGWRASRCRLDPRTSATGGRARSKRRCMPRSRPKPREAGLAPVAWKHSESTSLFFSKPQNSLVADPIWRRGHINSMGIGAPRH